MAELQAPRWAARLVPRCSCWAAATARSAMAAAPERRLPDPLSTPHVEGVAACHAVEYKRRWGAGSAAVAGIPAATAAAATADCWYCAPCSCTAEAD